MAATQFIFPILIIGIVALLYANGIAQYFSFESIKQHRHLLQDTVLAHPVLAPFVFVFAFTVVAILHLPAGAAAMQLTAGFLFAQPFCTIYSLVGGVFGGVVVFGIANTSLGEFMKNKVKGYKLGAKIEGGLRENGGLYLIILRALFPYWLMNIVPALFRVKLSTFIWTSMFGLLPRSWLYAEVGNNIAQALDQQSSNDDVGMFVLKILSKPDMQISLAGFGAVLITLMIVKKLVDKRAKQRKLELKEKEQKAT